MNEIHFCCGKLHACSSLFVFLRQTFYSVIPTSWDVVIIDSKTPSHSQAEELKADLFVVRVDQNNNSFVVRVLVDHNNNSYGIGAATTAAQYMHVESMVYSVWYDASSG